MKATNQYIEKELEGFYPKTEIEGISRLIFEAIFGWGFTEQVVKKHEKILTADLEKIKGIVTRLKKFEPIQYILGETEFYGLKLKVDTSVLIPRQETEELVHWIIQSEIPEEIIILDIGTGSGCIALALKGKFKKAKVFGIDISDQALEVARQNAVKNGLDVEFIKADILNWEHFEWGNYNVIVSNPPYIRELEKVKMHANVLNFEPENALFISDNDPLIFYRAIAEFAKKHLANKGWLFFEINENLGSEMNQLLIDFGFCNIEKRKDINGKDRMACCRNIL